MTNTDTCVACKCCFGLLIDVTGFDVHRLVRSLLLDAASLVTTAPSEELDDDLGFCLEPGGETFTLILRQRGTASPRCALLLGPMGAGAVAAAGLITLMKTIPTILAALKAGFKDLGKSTADAAGTADAADTGTGSLP